MTDLGVTFLKHWESCRLEAYQDLAGIWTIGWGYTDNVSPGMVITQDQADSLLKARLDLIGKVLKMAVEVPLTPNQADALTSLCYNIGIGNFVRSTLLRLLNQNNVQAASQEFLRWCHTGGAYSQGLENRRLAEQALFRGTAVI